MSDEEHILFNSLLRCSFFLILLLLSTLRYFKRPTILYFKLFFKMIDLEFIFALICPLSNVAVLILGLGSFNILLVNECLDTLLDQTDGRRESGLGLIDNLLDQ